MKKLIIGCGYLGLRVAAAWLRDGHEVAALTRSNSRAAELRNAGLEPIVGDVTQPETLCDLPETETVLFAVGFDRNAGPSMRDVYVQGLQNVLSHIGGRVPRFLHISSTSVYGQNAGEWIDEESPCEPVRENGCICLDAERLLREHGRQFPSMGIHILRLAGIYGPGRLLRRIEAVCRGEPIAGNPEGWLNLIHADDAVRAIAACEERGSAGQLCLVSDDRPVTRREYYTRLAELLGAPPPEFADATTGELNKRCRNTRLRDALGVKLHYPTMAEGLPHAIALALNNK